MFSYVRHETRTFVFELGGVLALILALAWAFG